MKDRRTPNGLRATAPGTGHHPPHTQPHTQPPVLRRLLRRLLAAVVAAALAAGLLGALAGTAYAVPPGSQLPATWNMLHTPEAWNAAYNLARTRDIVALQEVPEALPNNGNLIHVAAHTSPGHPYVIDHYYYVPQQQDLPVRNLYILRDSLIPTTLRLGFFTAREARHVEVVESTIEQSRPALAIVDGEGAEAVMFASIHAFSGGGGDAPTLVTQVSVAAGAESGGRWAVLGDYNRAPQTLQGSLPAGSRVYRPAQATQLSGNELDYLVSSMDVEAWDAVHVGQNYASDHYQVFFGAQQGGAETQVVAYRDTGTAELAALGEPVVPAADGSLVDAFWAQSHRQLWRSARSFAFGDEWFVQLQNVQSKKCLTTGTPFLATAPVVTATCSLNPAASELWSYDPALHTLSTSGGQIVQARTDDTTPVIALRPFSSVMFPNQPAVLEQRPVDLATFFSGGTTTRVGVALVDSSTHQRLQDYHPWIGSHRLAEGSNVSSGAAGADERWALEVGPWVGFKIRSTQRNEYVAVVGDGTTAGLVTDATGPESSWYFDGPLLKNMTTHGAMGDFGGGALHVGRTIRTGISVESYELQPVVREIPTEAIGKATSFLTTTMDHYGSPADLRVPRSYTGGHFAPGGEFGPEGYQASFTYDNALVITALLMQGSSSGVSHAMELGDSLLYAQAHDIVPDGRIRASYEPQPFVTATGTPYGGGFSVYTGNMAWAGMALTRLHHVTGEQRYLDGALRIANWIQANAADTRGAGGYTGGLRNSDGTGAEMTPIQWKATEHNIDTGAFFAMLAAATGDQVWKTRSDNAFAFVAGMQADDGRLWTGTGLDGVTQNRDTVPEDVQTWSYLATLSPAYARSVDWAAGNLAVTDGPFTGVSFGRTDTSKVWFEGTAHLLAAYYARGAAGDDAKAATLLDTLKLAQTQAPNGDGRGIVAASSDGLTTGEGDTYYASLHTGATAWFVIAALGRNPFRL
ncbi:hypothetical protein [Kitasatospora sp. A2-31]|uniref:hypothetical protein n=1 Tax=Kitasatospora sp. A2-31 TaxID=2916414 RepID=UPI001EED2B2A|nr:hypothetical protein [Kitasatospora sp. A2-31]MCG6499768.1 hypothetical protein [Kitasatospora sp. A2-31]